MSSTYSALSANEREIIWQDVAPDLGPDGCPEVPCSARTDIEAPTRGLLPQDVESKQKEVARSKPSTCRTDLLWCGVFLCGTMVLLAGGLAHTSSKMLKKVENGDEPLTGMDWQKPTTGEPTTKINVSAQRLAHPTYFVTLDTSGTPLVTQVGSPFEVFNLGLGKPWNGFKTKFQLLMPFLENRADSDLIAFMDGADVFWGGCEMDEFLRSYHEIVARSHAPIVVGAEIACGEQECWRVPRVPLWADHMSHRNLGGGFWEHLVSPTGCKNPCCPCSRPPAVKFLNSGFFMGPDLREMVKWSLEHYDEVSTLGDQSVIAYYWFHAGKSKITLDYAGELCLTMSDLQPWKLFNLTHDGHIWNKAFGRQQCFIHGNGRSRGPMWDLLGSFARRPEGHRYLEVFAEKRKEKIQRKKLAMEKKEELRKFKREMKI